jgi:quercetin dioxygenase-like cupin family protein
MTDSSIRVINSTQVKMKKMSEQVSMAHWYSHSGGSSVGIFNIHVKRGEVLAIPPHSHGEEILYVISGSTVLDGQRIRKGDIVLIPAGLSHGGAPEPVVADEDVELLSIISPAQDYGDETP